MNAVRRPDKLGTGIPFRTSTAADGAGGLAAAVPSPPPAPLPSWLAVERGVVILVCTLAFESP